VKSNNKKMKKLIESLEPLGIDSHEESKLREKDQVRSEKIYYIKRRENHGYREDQRNGKIRKGKSN